ncbi:MAG: DNA polymerase IV [Stappiaceae bacterium]
MSCLCRDCLSWSKPPTSQQSGRRCPECGSPRLLFHPEIAKLSMAHIDCDAFYASVEKRDNPELADKPVIIGGGKRGVVSTACYVARIHGVHSAMPMFKALAACPNAVVIKPDMKKYTAVGRQIRSMMRTLTPMVEPLSIDEAFLDLSGTVRLHHAPPAETLARFVHTVEREVGVTISVGLSYNKFLAKVASDLEKPKGFSIIGNEEALDFLEDKSVSLIWGVGKAFKSRLAKDGLHTIGQLQHIPETDLAKKYGAMGLRLSRLSRGLDARTVKPRNAAKSVSTETTFNTDIADIDALLISLRRLSESVSRRLKKSEIAGRTVVLKLKTHDFKTITRNRQLSDPTQLADRLFSIGSALLKREADGRRFRLLGIGVSDLSDAESADPVDLVDPDAERRAKAERAIDHLRDKFGDSSVELGMTFGNKRKPESKPP